MAVEQRREAERKLIPPDHFELTENLLTENGLAANQVHRRSSCSSGSRCASRHMVCLAFDVAHEKAELFQYLGNSEMDS